MPQSLLNVLENPDALPQIMGEFRPLDEWQQHVNRLVYGLRFAALTEHSHTFATADYRLAHALAADYFSRACAREKTRSARTEGRVLRTEPQSSVRSPQPPDSSPLTVMEWGCGNGNLAACFLGHLKQLDRDGLIYPRVRYLMVDRSDEVLKGAIRHPDLAGHRAKVEMIQGDALELGTLKDQSVDRIVCNELWSELPTKLMLRKQSDLMEEHLRPNLTAGRHAAIPDWSAFVRAFGAADAPTLRGFPPFLDDIVWEKEYQPVAWQAVPYRKTVTAFFKQMDEEVLVPVNIGAFQTLREAKRLLAPDGIGFSSFDAGTADMTVLNDPEKPCYGQIGGLFSFMVNYALVQAVAEHLGLSPSPLESQRAFVSRALATNVIGLLDLLAAHPKAGTLGPSGQDRLALETIQALNREYESPYERRIHFPVSPDIPEGEQQALLALMGSLKPRGVPDTVGYLTEGEVLKALPGLKRLGFEEAPIRDCLAAPPLPVDYFHCSFPR